MTRMKRILAAALAAVWALAAHASGLETLESFVKSAHSGHAEFTQVVTAPAHDGQPPRSKTSSGTFEFLRPNRFRFDYRKPFEQTIVADGQTLWLYDADLNQVTARKQAQALGSTPAALVAASPDVNSLRKDFNLEAAGNKDGMQWVHATPKTKDGQLTSVGIAFRGNDLAQLEILDSFGQRSVITFTKMELNGNVPAEKFQFKPPKGADVVKQ
jgi:outer membrane lipoprotein carrier protein